MRSRNKRDLFSFVFFLTVCLLVYPEASAGPVDETPSRGDAFVTASSAEPSNLIPLLASDSASAEVSRFIFNGLLKYDKELDLVGDLAERWDVEDGGLKLVFHLKKNVRWQDGFLFTARDVLFTYKRVIDPDVPTPYGGGFEKVSSVIALDDWTVEVRYSEPFSPGLSSWTIGILPEHLLAGQDFQNTIFAREPIGTGPYFLKKWVPGQSLLLQANPQYFEGRPLLDRILIRIIPDPTTAFLELQTEDLDGADLTPLQFERQIGTSFFRSKYRAYRWTGLQYIYLGYNLKNPLFEDKRVRQALAMVIRPEEIIQGVLMGHGRRLSGPFLPESWAYDPGVRDFPEDIEAARRLLAETGWRDSDGDGILDREGKAFEFTVLTSGGNDQRRMTCEILQRQLAAAGVRMKIQTVEWGTLLKEFIRPKRFDAVLMGWNLALDPDVYDIFHSSRTGPGQFNFVSFHHEEVDRLLEQARKTFDRGERAALYRRVHAIIHDEQPYVFLYAPESLTLLHKRFQGVTEGKLGIGFDFIRWFVPKDSQKYPSVRADV